MNEWRDFFFAFLFVSFRFILTGNDRDHTPVGQYILFNRIARSEDRKKANPLVLFPIRVEFPPIRAFSSSYCKSFLVGFFCYPFRFRCSMYILSIACNLFVVAFKGIRTYVHLLQPKNIRDFRPPPSNHFYHWKFAKNVIIREKALAYWHQKHQVKDDKHIKMATTHAGMRRRGKIKRPCVCECVSQFQSHQHYMRFMPVLKK